MIAKTDPFLPYTVVDVQDDPEILLDQIHRQFFHGKGPDTTKGAKADKAISFDFSDFVQLCTDLAGMAELVSVTAWESAEVGGWIDPSRIDALAGETCYTTAAPFKSAVAAYLVGGARPALRDHPSRRPASPL